MLLLHKVMYSTSGKDFLSALSQLDVTAFSKCISNYC